MAAIDEFRANIILVQNLIGLGQALAAQTTLDPSDIYRSALAMAVSALDRYVHEKVAQEMMAVHRGTRATTAAFDRFPVKLAPARVGVANAASDAWLEAEIREVHALKAFQKADAIAEAIRLCSPVELWVAVGAQLGVPSQDAKIRVNLIVDRRNQIVHEFDIDPTTPGARWPITAALSVDTTVFILSLGEAIEVVA